MDARNNARLTPTGREALGLAVVDSGSKARVARWFNTTPKVVDK
jgi:hypothetical protein